jgi:hypothetical protein
VSHTMSDDDAPDPLHEFTVTLFRASEITPAMIDALDEAGCGDAVLYRRDGFIRLDFDRRAPTLLAAQMRARADVMRAGFEVFSISSPSP